MAPIRTPAKEPENKKDYSAALQVVPAPNLLPPPSLYHVPPPVYNDGPSASPSDKDVQYDDLDHSKRPGPPYTLPNLPKRPPKKFYRRKKPYYNRRKQNKRPSKPHVEEEDHEERNDNIERPYREEGHDVIQADPDTEHVPVSASIVYGQQEEEEDPYHKNPPYREDVAPTGNGKFSPADAKSIYAPSPYMSMPSPFRPGGSRLSERNMNPKETQESNVGFTRVSKDGHTMPSFDSFGDFSPPVFSMR